MRNVIRLGITAATFVSLCNSLVSMAEEDAQTLSKQAQQSIKQKDYQAAVDFADKSIKIQPSAVAFLMRAKACYELNKYDDANKAATESLKLDPKLGPAYMLRAMARKSLGDSKGCLEDAKKAADVNPGNFPQLSMTAMMETENKDFKGALEHYNLALKLYEERSQSQDAASQNRPIGSEVVIGLYRGRAEVNAMLGNQKDAIADYDKAIVLNAGMPRLYVDRGAIKDDMGDHKGAITDYDSAIKLKPGDAVAYKLRSAAKIEIGDKAGAEADLEQAKTLSK